MHLGVFGGSFNPPHIGHLIVAERIREERGLDEVLWVPAARPPHKLEADIAPSDHRLAMLDAALAGNSQFRVSDIELTRGGVSYTIDTLEEIRRALGGDSELYLIIGGDSYREIASWHRPAAICSMAGLLVYPRGETHVVMQDGFPASVVDAPLIDVSSTEIRDRIRTGKSIRYLVTESVRDYIDRHGLYVSEGPPGS